MPAACRPAETQVNLSGTGHAITLLQRLSNDQDAVVEGWQGSKCPTNIWRFTLTMVPSKCLTSDKGLDTQYLHAIYLVGKPSFSGNLIVHLAIDSHCYCLPGLPEHDSIHAAGKQLHTVIQAHKSTQQLRRHHLIPATVSIIITISISIIRYVSIGLQYLSICIQFTHCLQARLVSGCPVLSLPPDDTLKKLVYLWCIMAGDSGFQLHWGANIVSDLVYVLLCCNTNSVAC